MPTSTNKSRSTTTARQLKVTLNLTKRFDDLIQRCDAWDAGAYKTANDQLYDLLADTFVMFEYIANGDHDVRKLFNNLLKERKVPYQDNTPIQTRVIRLVFGINRKRAYTYANVLRLARASKKTASELADWIRDSGGVQEVSAAATGRVTTAAKAKANAALASDTFAKANAIADLGKLPVVLKPGQAEYPNYSLALVRSTNGSTGEIVWGTNNPTAITRVLAIAGKELSDTKATDDAAKKVRKDRTSATDAVSELIVKVAGAGSVKANGKQTKSRTTASVRKIAA
jgi:hypothetical protein